jgi:hypothetical protein
MMMVMMMAMMMIMMMILMLMIMGVMMMTMIVMMIMMMMITQKMILIRNVNAYIYTYIPMNGHGSGSEHVRTLRLIDNVIRYPG